ncbi:MAG: thioredoxin-like domain-containing protein [bacterium]
MTKYLALFILVLAANASAQITIEGTVTDANGKAPQLAHAHIGKFNDDKHSTSTPCTPDGHYSIQIPKAGIYTLRLSAVDHEEVSIPLFLDESEKSVTVNCKLSPNGFVKEPEKITVIGDWNKFAFASTEQMTPTKSADGRTVYTYERAAIGDTLSYQLMGSVEGGHSVNGQSADYFTYDGGGDYRSVMRTKKGDKVVIIYDPAKSNYMKLPNLPIVDIRDNPFIKNAYAFHEAVIKLRDATFTKNPKTGAEDVDTAKYNSMLSKIIQVFRNTTASGDKRMAQFALGLLAKVYNSELPSATENADLIMNSMPANSQNWVIATSSIGEIITHGTPKLAATYSAGLRTHPEPTVRAIVLVKDLELAYNGKNEPEARRLYTMLKKDYADVKEIKWEVNLYNPDAAVQVGKDIPSFEVALLDGSGKVSNTSMLGRYYMIDFWATWCGPCVREMPAIHKAYEKFKGRKGFEILSLSMDAAEAQIAPFRTKKWKMPWLHAFIPGIFDASLAKKFEVAGIPKPVLVGPDGKVVAMQETLRGETLEKTLGKFLGEVN